VTIEPFHVEPARPPRPASLPSRGAGGLSAAAARYRDLLDLPLTPLAADSDHSALRDRTSRIDAFLSAWFPGRRASLGSAGAGEPLWSVRELAKLSRLPAADLAAEWRSRLARSLPWLTALLQPGCDHARAWCELPSGDFDLDGRGLDYTRGMAGSQAARWSGSRLLLDLLGALGEGGDYLDVLGGDGYVWRLLAALRSTGEGTSAPPARVVTNDVSRHMFLQAGLWGAAAREEAGRLTRTFRPAAFDGVLVAYGTHHIADFAAAVEHAAQVVRPGRPVVVHDFFDEGPVGRWFGEVVDRWGKTRHEMPHVGPLLMAVELYLAGLRDIELFEMSDPFLFVADADSAHSARRRATEYLAGMYGLDGSPPVRQGRLEEVVRRVMSYPELGRTGVFREDFVYVPRFAVASRGRRPVDPAAPLGDGDRVLVARLTTLLRDGPAVARDLPREVRCAWFADAGRWWGVPQARRLRFLRWADGLAQGVPVAEAGNTQGTRQLRRSNR
jgi:SAM-dependent methyltransferase